MSQDKTTRITVTGSDGRSVDMTRWFKQFGEALRSPMPSEPKTTAATLPLDLLPCPFCGAVPEQPTCYQVEDGAGGKWGRVVCGCGACAPDVRTGYYKDVTHWAQDAADEWNRRP